MFWLNRTKRWPVPEDAYYMAGAGGQYAIIIPTHDLVVVRLGHYKGVAAGERALWRALELLMQLVPQAREPWQPPLGQGDDSYSRTRQGAGSLTRGSALSSLSSSGELLGPFYRAHALGFTALSVERARALEGLARLGFDPGLALHILGRYGLAFGFFAHQ